MKLGCPEIALSLTDPYASFVPRTYRWRTPNKELPAREDRSPELVRSGLRAYDSCKSFGRKTHFYSLMSRPFRPSTFAARCSSSPSCPSWAVPRR